MSGPAAKLSGSIFDPLQPFGPTANNNNNDNYDSSNNNNGIAPGTGLGPGQDGNSDQYRNNNNNGDDDDLASLRPFVMDTAQVQGLGGRGTAQTQGLGGGEPGMGSYDTTASSSSSMLPDIEMTSPLPVAVAAAATAFNDGDVTGGTGDYDMTTAFLPYQPPLAQSTAAATTMPATVAATGTGALIGAGTGTVLSKEVMLACLLAFLLVCLTPWSSFLIEKTHLISTTFGQDSLT